MERDNLREKAKFGFRLIISLIAIYWILTSIEISKIVETALGADFFLVAGAALLYISGDLLSAKKLEMLLETKEASTWKIVKHYYVGKLFNSFLPSTIGGDAVKSYRIDKELKESNGYSAVFMERFTGLIALLSIAVISSIIWRNTMPREILAIIYLVFIPAITVITFFTWSELFRKTIRKAIERLFPDTRIVEKLEKFHRSLFEYRKKPKLVAKTLVVSIVFHLMLAGVNILLALGLGIEAPLGFFLLFVPVAAIILFMPISVGGFGAREVIYTFFLSMVSVEAASAVSLALFFNSMVIIAALIGVAAYLTD